MLRTHTLLHGPDVLLSDLFTNAGPNAHRRLGPAPPAGGSIVVEAAQLGAIARQFGVDWRPESSGDRAVLERPGRTLPRAEVLAAVRRALQSAGASDDCEIELPGFSPPLVPADADPRLVVSQLDYQAESGRFTAILSVTGTLMDPINLRIAGVAEDTADVPVTVARMPAGAILQAGDLRMARVRTALLHAEVVHALAEAVGMQLRHPARAGQPLAQTDLKRPALVQRGALVRIELRAGGISLSAQGVARDAGALGEVIRVVNTSSHAVIEAVVSGPNTVRVMPGSTPLRRTATGYDMGVP